MKARLRMWLARRQQKAIATWCGIDDLTDGELYRAYRMRRAGHRGPYTGDRIRSTRARRGGHPGMLSMQAVRSRGLRG